MTPPAFLKYTIAKYLGTLHLAHPVTNRSISHDSTDGVFERLVDILAPNRNDVVAVLEAYFDESFDRSLLCVAGYVFAKTKAKALNREWGHMLRENGLPYFRMSACAHGNEPFDGLSKPQRDFVARTVIKLIGKYASVGVAITVDQEEYEKVVPLQSSLGGPYEFCVWSCLMGVRAWMDQTNKTTGKVGYFFEAGHAHQKSAHKLMDQLFNEPELRERYRYAAHGFVDKVVSRPSQAADMFAYQWFKDRKRAAKGLGHRRDCEALIHSTWHIAKHIDARQHADLIYRTFEGTAQPASSEILPPPIEMPSQTTPRRH